MAQTAFRRDRALAAIALLAGFAPGLAAPSRAAQSAAPVSARAVTVDVGAQDPAISPDGTRIAVGVLGKIFVLPMEGGAVERMTDGIGWDSSPAWSPDGRHLAYAHALPSGTHIVILDLGSGTSRFVHRVDGRVRQLRYHPDGADLYFVLERNQYDAHVWKVSAAGGDERQLTETENWHEWSFALSPDGERLLLESGRYEGTDLYLLEIDDRSATRLTRTPDRELQARWAPDGTRVWIAQRDGVDRVLAGEPGGEARVVHESPYDEKTLAIAPDGGSVVMAAERRLYRIDLATARTTPIPFTATFERLARGPADMVVTNARLFDGTGDQYLANATIVVRDGRIERVHQGPPGAADAGLPVLDAGGRVVMSGLMDNHYHYWDPFAGMRLLTHGVTAARDPGVAVSTSLSFKDAIRLGLVPGPDLYTAGPLIDGLNGYHPAVDVALETPAAAAPLVAALADQGVDLLKVYFLLEPDVLAAVVDAAHDHGLPVTGHIGVRTSWEEAIDAGIDGLTHIRVWKDFLPPEIQPQGEDESLDSRRDRIARMQADWRLIDPSGERVGALIDRIVETGTALDPTLAVQRIRDSARRGFSLEEFEIARASYGKMQRFVARAHEAGATILAGTDNVHIVDELEAYEQAGIPRADILRAATVNGARWLGRDDEFGTVQPGRAANLIIVDGDPLERIGALRDITHVIKDGWLIVRRSPAGQRP